jgi:serine-type D-Ala-D-Ala carboxypeptidase (penicillin-binding protein 5/6)
MTKTTVEPAVAPRPARRRRLWLSVAVLATALAGGGYIALRLVGPLPAPQVVQTLPRVYVIPGTPPVLPWPQTGQAMVEAEGLGELGSVGGSRPVPIASVAKVMTAYVVLRDHPLRPDEDGPTLTVSADEAAAYPAQLASGESLVQVVAGEALTERQALQALLLPAANNVAYILARWDAGNMAAFVAKMNQTAAQLGMTHTRYTDPSGLDPTTVSTAADQVTLARTAIKVPALAQIVAMPQATLPVVGLVKNVNTLLGQDGIVGIKTGSTDQAGGCLVFAAQISAEGHQRRILGAILGPGPTLADAFTASRRLIQAGSGMPHRYRVVHAGQPVATVRGPRGSSSTTLAATSDLDVLGWPGLSYRVDTRATVPGRIAAAARVGTLQLTASGTSVTTAVQTTSALVPPTWWQRMTRR